MSRNRIEVFEHQTLRVGEPLRTVNGREVRLTERDHDAIARFNDATGRRFFEIGHRRVVLTQFVGYVEVGDLAIEILPKTDDARRAGDETRWRDALLEMLRVAANLRLESPARASQEANQSSLLELVALRFVEEVERLLHHGLAKGYRDEETNGPTFRGRLLVTSNLRENLVRADRFYVRFVQYDRDIVVNRILRDALDELSGLSLSAGVSGRATASRAAFPDLGSMPVTAELFDRLHLGRSTARYRDALVLARMILERNAPQLRHGRAPVFALLFDMNVLWERYVAALFRRSAPAGLEVAAQDSRPFWRPTGESIRTIRPDIVVRAAGNRTVLVADTKWKVPREKGPSSADLEQVFAYNELYGSPRALLVYPAAADAHSQAGPFHGRLHTCGTTYLGLFEGGRFRRDAMKAQVADLLASAVATNGAAA